jgi:hypothetical protein
MRKNVIGLALAACAALAACGNSTPSTWDGMKGLTASQIAERMECTGYSENDGPTFNPDEPAGVVAVGACNIDYAYPHTLVSLHAYPSRAYGEEVRKSWESVNGKGSTVWADNVLVVFESHDAEQLAEAIAGGHEAAPVIASLSPSP